MERAAQEPELQALAAALTGAVDEALEVAADDLEEEVCRRAGAGVDRAEVQRARSGLVQRLRAGMAGHAERCRQTLAEHFLRPSFGRASRSSEEQSLDRIPSLAELEAADSVDPGADGERSSLAGEELGPAEMEQHYDEELARAAVELAEAVRRGRELEAESQQLDRQLSQAKAVDSTLCGGPLACNGSVEKAADELRGLSARLRQLRAGAPLRNLGSGEDDPHADRAGGPGGSLSPPKRPSYGLAGGRIETWGALGFSPKRPRAGGS
mmetsp:Transcript_21017/g.65729  ORF Transcript_21017/g.65729 Transcript_21017/m.65729 type:complete len:268 (-) Transcript_21017:59-862(-)